MAFLLLLLLPSVAYADFNSFLTHVNNLIINPLISLLFAVAMMYFLYGVYVFIANQTNEEKRTNGRNHMIWGIVGITVMMGVWGLLNIVTKTFNIKGIDPQNNNVRLEPYNPTWPPTGR